MDTELVVSQFLSKTDDEGVGLSATPLSDYFYEALPYYMYYGMSQEEFWDGDVWLAKAYRKLHELKEDQFNRHAHLQGAYVYEAICDVSPILQAFAKSGTKATPYPTEPFGLTKEEEQSEQSKRDKQTRKAMSVFQGYAEAWNAKFLKERGDDNGRRGDECSISPDISGQPEGDSKPEGIVTEPHEPEGERERVNKRPENRVKKPAGPKRSAKRGKNGKRK